MKDQSKLEAMVRELRDIEAIKQQKARYCQEGGLRFTATTQKLSVSIKAANRDKIIFITNLFHS